MVDDLFLPYQAGDKLEIYRLGQDISPWNKSWTLLFFCMDDLDVSRNDMTQAGKNLTSRIRHFARNNNFVYVGDLVTRTEQELRHMPQAAGCKLGAKTFNALEDVIAGEMGLNFGLRVCGGWPAENVEAQRLRLPRSGRNRWGAAVHSVQAYLAPVIR